MGLAIDMSDGLVAAEHPPLTGVGPYPADALFFGMPRHERNFGGEAGLAQGPSFTPDEMRRIEALIQRHMADNAHRISPKTADAVAATSLRDYHRIADNAAHGAMLSKLGRILPKPAVDEIRQMSFFDYVRAAFGPFSLSDEEEIGYEQICFRVVRPGRREDVGSLHRDSWFWQHFGFKVADGVQRTKVWVPVVAGEDQAGLLLAPGSHRLAGGYLAHERDGKLCFVPQIDADAVQLKRFMGRAGDPIMFNYDTLHVGAVARGDTCRVSFEITILYRA